MKYTIVPTPLSTNIYRVDYIIGQTLFSVEHENTVSLTDFLLKLKEVGQGQSKYKITYFDKDGVARQVLTGEEREKYLQYIHGGR
jgi:hypothetical protein